MHILSVSGLHVAVIYIIIDSLLKFMNKKRKLFILKSVIVIAFIWLFALIAGLAPSVFRSALMLSLVVLGKLLKKNSNTYNIIFSSAFVLLLINPYNLFDVGFLLSYLAVLSIVYFQPYIYKLLVFENWFLDKIWALLSVSFAAQLGTMPVGFYYFHQFPNYFFITNVVAIPLSSMILYLAVFLLFISFVPFLAKFVAFLLKINLKLFLGSLDFIDKIPYSVSTDIYITPLQVFIMYAIIISIFTFFVYNRKQLLYLFLTSILIFVSINLINKIINTKNKEFIVYNTRKDLILNIIDGKNNIIISDTSVFSDGKVIKFSIKPYWITRQVKNPQKINIDSAFGNIFQNKNCFLKNSFFQVENKRFILLNNTNILKNQTDKKIALDYVILSQNVYLDIAELSNFFEYKTIVFDGSNKSWRILKWKEQCKELNINYFDITTQGAFFVKL